MQDSNFWQIRFDTGICSDRAALSSREENAGED